MKRMCLLFAVLAVLGQAGIYAHEKGDLVLNIEPQAGIGFFLKGIGSNRFVQ